MANGENEFFRRQLSKYNESLSKKARNFFKNPDIADQALEYALKKLKEDDFKRLCEFDGKSSEFKDFLFVVVGGLLVDYPRVLFFQHYDFLKEEIHRHLKENPATADQAFNYVIEKLAEDNFRRLRNFEGRIVEDKPGKFRNYLSKVVKNLLIDYTRKAWNIVYKTPDKVKEIGELAVKVYEQLYIKRCTVGETIELLSEEYRIEIEKTIKEIMPFLEKKWERSKYTGALIPVAQVDEHPDPADRNDMEQIRSSLSYSTPDEVCQTLNQEAIKRAVFHILVNDEPPDLEGSIQSKLVQLHSKLDLSEENRGFLETVSEKDGNVSEAGRHMGWNKDQTSGRFRRLKNKISKAIKASGLTKEELELLIRIN